LSKRKKQPGAIVEIQLGDGMLGFGRVLEPPFLAVYDIIVRTRPSIEEICRSSVLFVVGVFTKALGRMEQLGFEELRAGEIPIPDRFIQNVANPKHCRLVDVAGNERDVEPGECVGREAAAIWDLEDIAERIQDHYAGRENKIVRTLRVTL
jgi:hypothetical protein